MKNTVSLANQRRVVNQLLVGKVVTSVKTIVRVHWLGRDATATRWASKLTAACAELLAAPAYSDTAGSQLVSAFYLTNSALTEKSYLVVGSLQLSLELLNLFFLLLDEN